MKRKLFYLSIFVAALVANFISCTDQSYQVTPSPVTLDISATSGNPVTTLGKVLFYDTHLSANSAISCATCHKQALAFSDNVDFSRGFQNSLTLRNSLPIQNLTCTMCSQQPELFWDGRETALQTMVLRPILNHVEMGMGSVDDVVERVKSISYYSELFQSAYGSDNVDANGIAVALSDFVGSIKSANTHFDKFQVEQATFTALELKGQALFFEKYNCNSCHQTAVPNGYSQGGGFVNIGLDLNYTDNGRANFTHDPADNGKFKIPNLRNIALTAPYMHDGRFATLDEVMEHYSHGIADHPALDPRLQGTDGHAKQMNIAEDEKAAIIAFMNTLTDYTMITDQQYSSPFKVQ